MYQRHTPHPFQNTGVFMCIEDLSALYPVFVSRYLFSQVYRRCISVIPHIRFKTQVYSGVSKIYQCYRARVALLCLRPVRQTPGVFCCCRRACLYKPGLHKPLLGLDASKNMSPVREYNAVMRRIQCEDGPQKVIGDGCGGDDDDDDDDGHHHNLGD